VSCLLLKVDEAAVATQWIEIISAGEFISPLRSRRPQSLRLQAILDFRGFDFRGFDFRDFRFNAVCNSILFSSPLVLLSNLDLRGFCFRGFCFVSPH
jgi:hypothetical protein